MENPVLIVLSIMAIGMLVAVTGGVAYLTAAEWRDRRRREREKRSGSKG
ncbi:hypothetical protein [Kamptonema formosum]|nr:hypothetical protein [Oscillatoria sp. PCC 10802]